MDRITQRIKQRGIREISSISQIAKLPDRYTNVFICKRKHIYTTTSDIEIPCERCRLIELAEYRRRQWNA